MKKANLDLIAMINSTNVLVKYGNLDFLKLLLENGANKSNFQ